MPLDPALQRTLLAAARDSVAVALQGTCLMPDGLPDLPPLSEPRATFVTLKREDTLRGCIGTLEPVRPLLLDVVHNARTAAFRDPRFRPVSAVELPKLRFEISVLSVPIPIQTRTRRELLLALRPGVDGLIVQGGARRATFLPSVWDMLPDPDDFIAQLLRKAGLRTEGWSTDWAFQRYTAEHFQED